MRRVASVFGVVLRSHDLLRVELAFAGFNAAELGVWVAMLVYAYDRGGATTAGIVAVVQLVPAALFAPIAGVLGDRYPPARVLVLGYVAQAIGMGATAASLLADAPAPVSYFLAATAATAVTITRPTQNALVPSLARSPDELTAVNVVSGWVESSMVLAGPALTGALLAVSSPGTVFAVFSVGGAAAALLVAPVAARRARGAAHEDESVSEDARAELAAGFRTLARNPAPRLIVLILTGGFVVWGALDVLAVVLAVGVLDMGNSGAGYLTAAFGAGGVLGAASAAFLVGRRHLAPPLVAAALVWGGAFTAIAIHPTTIGTLALLAVAGVGRSIVEVTALTLLQRIAPSDVLARVLGVNEGLSMAALAVGSIIVPVFVAAGGAKTALVAAGAILPVIVLVRLRPLLAVDAEATVPIVEISLLRSMRIFASLPPPAIEGLAHSLVPVEAPAGTVVIRQGDVGDRFYAIADGEVEVTANGTHVATLGRGEGFGEIALLSDVSRTATVTARSDTHLYALEKEPFVIALTGHAPARHEADAIARERGEELARLS